MRFVSTMLDSAQKLLQKSTTLGLRNLLSAKLRGFFKQVFAQNGNPSNVKPQLFSLSLALMLWYSGVVRLSFLISAH